MSDPVTNVEIEDVLSSIRKLVAEESRADPVVRRSEKPARLVLTPAQRVRPEDARNEPVLLTQPIKEDTPSPKVTGETTIDRIPGDARLFDFVDVESAFPDIDEFENADTRTDATPATARQPEAEDMSGRGELSRLIEQEVSAALSAVQSYVESDSSDDDSNAEIEASVDLAVEGSSALADDDSDEESIDADHSEYGDADPTEIREDALGDAEDSAVYDGADSDHDDSDWDVPESAEDDLYPADEVTLRGPDPQDEDWSDVDLGSNDAPVADEVPAPSPPQTLEDKVAALSRLVSRDTGEFEEERDRPDTDELTAASDPMAWPDPAPFIEVAEEDEASAVSNVVHAENAWPKSQAADQAPEAPAAKKPAADPVPDMVPALTRDAPSENTAVALQIDEVELRALVGDIVRQELQGALGERITRNVRKLVRREIHRMLISQEFD